MGDMLIGFAGTIAVAVVIYLIWLGHRQANDVVVGLREPEWVVRNNQIFRTAAEAEASIEADRMRMRQIEAENAWRDRLEAGMHPPVLEIRPEWSEAQADKFITALEQVQSSRATTRIVPTKTEPGPQHHCPYCSVLNDDGAATCTQCGGPQPKKGPRVVQHVGDNQVLAVDYLQRGIISPSEVRALMLYPGIEQPAPIELETTIK